MKVEANMNPVDEFYVNGWWAKTPEYVLISLQRQLEAASAVWPELAGYRIEKPRSRSKADAGAAGGVARAAALSPERRSEIASEAAKVRWETTDTGSVT